MTVQRPLPSRDELLARLASTCGFEGADLSAPRMGRFEQQGLSLAYLDWGGSGQPIIFLHGGALTSHTWDYVCLILRDRFRCIALDLRGHGDSSWSDDYRIEAGVRDVEALRTHLQLPYIHVVGMSLGGNIAGHYAATHADRVSSLVLVDVGPGVNFAASQALRNFVQNIDGIDDLAFAVNMAMNINPRGNHDKVMYRLLHSVERREDELYHWKIDRRQPHDFEHILGKLDEIAELAPHMRCPALVVRGSRSRIFTGDAARACAAMFPRGEFAEVSHAGHSVQEDNPAELAAKLVEFYSKRPSPCPLHQGEDDQ